MEVMKVSANTEVKSLAGAVAQLLRKGEEVEVQAIGAGTVNTAVKGIAVARGFLAPIGIDLYCAPCFTVCEVGGEERTALRFILADKNRK